MVLRGVVYKKRADMALHRQSRPYPSRNPERKGYAMSSGDLSGTDENHETWQPVPGYEGIYSASNLGAIRRDVRSKGYAAGRILKPSPNGTGYFKVVLCKPGTKNRQLLVHRVVLSAFVGPCPKGMEANHKNGIKTDNRVSNLEYVTPSENQRHKREVLGYVDISMKPYALRGEAHQNSKLTSSDVAEIRELYAEGILNQRQIAALFGTTQSNVGFIVRGIGWSHLPHANAAPVSTS